MVHLTFLRYTIAVKSKLFCLTRDSAISEGEKNTFSLLLQIMIIHYKLNLHHCYTTKARAVVSATFINLTDIIRRYYGNISAYTPLQSKVRLIKKFKILNINSLNLPTRRLLLYIIRNTIDGMRIIVRSCDRQYLLVFQFRLHTRDKISEKKIKNLTKGEVL